MTHEQSIQHLTDLMATICDYHYKHDQWQDSHLRIHESGEAGISIDLYHFEGDGKDVIDGLRNTLVRHDDGSEQRGWLFCMTYNPDEEATPLQFLFTPNDGEDIALSPESIDWNLLDDITEWLEAQMQPSSSSVARDSIAELTAEEKQLLKSTLEAVVSTWRRSPGMNIGTSQVHNLYSSDLDILSNIIEKL